MSALVTKLETTLPLEHRIHLWVLDSVYAFLRKITPSKHKAFRGFLEGSAAPDNTCQQRGYRYSKQQVSFLIQTLGLI